MGADTMRLLPRYASWVILMFVLVALVGWAAVGCEEIGNGAAESTAPTSSTDTSISGDTVSSDVVSSSTTAESTAASVTGTTLASTEVKLPNGHIKSMGFIRSVWVDGGGRHLKIDYCDIVHGDEATAAARADGEIGPTEEWDLDFYVRNQSNKLRTWRVSNSVVITTSTRWSPHDGMGAPCSWSDFIGFWSGGSLPDGDSQLHDVPWWIERDGDVVVKIDEQYLP